MNLSSDLYEKRNFYLEAGYLQVGELKIERLLTVTVMLLLPQKITLSPSLNVPRNLQEPIAMVVDVAWM